MSEVGLPRGRIVVLWRLKNCELHIKRPIPNRIRNPPSHGKSPSATDSDGASLLAKKETKTAIKRTMGGGINIFAVGARFELACAYAAHLLSKQAQWATMRSHLSCLLYNNHMSSRMIALFAIIIASLLWSSAPVVAKILLQSFDPYPLIFVRFGIASILIAPIFLKYHKKNLITTIKDLFPVALFWTGNALFFYLGVARTTANATVLIYTSAPLITAFFARRFLAETLTANKIAGVIMGLFGILLILILPSLGQIESLTGDMYGNILILIASVSTSGYTASSRFIIERKRYSPLAVSSMSMFVTTIVFGFLTIITPHKDFIAPLFSLQTALLMAHSAILLTIATLFLYQWGIQKSSATLASFTNYLQPVFAIILNVIILGEIITGGFIIGSILVFVGLSLATGPGILKELNKLRKN